MATPYVLSNAIQVLCKRYSYIHILFMRTHDVSPSSFCIYLMRTCCNPTLVNPSAEQSTKWSERGKNKLNIILPL